MWRVLVPLDGSEEAASVIPDAGRLAGPGGTLILVTDAAGCGSRWKDGKSAVVACRTYLEAVAQSLRADGFQVETYVSSLGDPATVIERAAAEQHADIMAIATRERTTEERWKRGSVAWTALMRSTVPVVIRRSNMETPGDPSGRAIMVPLDGSELAEAALPLAQALACFWRAPIWLIQVVADGAPGDVIDRADAYLTKIAEGLAGQIHTSALVGPVGDTLVEAVSELAITDIVMTSHGKTGLTRVIVGSVADELIHRVTCPITIIPPLLTLGEEVEEALVFEHERALAGAVSH